MSKKIKALFIIQISLGVAIFVKYLFSFRTGRYGEGYFFTSASEIGLAIGAFLIVSGILLRRLYK